MPLSERIVVNPEILAGKPVIRGTRLAVEFILELLATGQSECDVPTNYPGLTREDILACQPEPYSKRQISACLSD